ncbi:MAG TPA: acetylornithine deacetylase [Woeseiaceae bacterium]
MPNTSYYPILQQLIAFPTVSADSNLPLIDYTESLLDDHGFRTERRYNDERTKANLLARIGPDQPGGLALAGHTDVVPVEGQDWQTDPFQLVEKSGNLHGRGTSDMKGFIALALAAAIEVDARRLKKPLHLIFTYDEEIGCLGAAALQDELAALADKPRFVLIGEPTGMQLVSKHKGIQNMVTRIRGKPAHSSRPDLGASAILFAARFATGIQNALPQESDASFNPPTATFNAGIIEGGAAVNIIPEWCELRWEFRHLPGQDAATIHAELQRLSERIRADMPGIAVDTRIVAGVPGLQAGANIEIVAELRQLIKSPEPTIDAVPFVTEGGLFQDAGVPAVICGPGLLEQAHQPNEYVSVQAMNDCRDFLARLIDINTQQ